MSKFVYFIKNLTVSLAVGIVTLVVSVIILGVSNIYLTGHGNNIFEKDISIGKFGEIIGFSGGIDDLITIVITVLSIILTFTFTYLRSGRTLFYKINN